MKRRSWMPLGCAALLSVAGQSCSSAEDPSGAGGTTSGAGGATSSTTSTTTSIPTTTTTFSTAGSGGSTGELPDTFTVTGVVTDGDAPISGAIVMQAGGSPAFTTGPDGVFSIELTKDIPGTRTVVAAKIGYRSAGAEFLALPDGPTVRRERRRGRC